MSALFTYLLRLADDRLILSHRLGEWSSRAPDLEEDIALTNIGLDLLGHARSLYQYAAEVEGAGRDEDLLAFHRDEREFFNLVLVEQPNGSFADTIARQFLFDAFQLPQWKALMVSSNERLAGIAAKAHKEAQYHLRHSRSWLVRLGDGTDLSHDRMQKALIRVWRYSAELFWSDEVESSLPEVAALPETLRSEWLATVTAAIADATLAIPDTPSTLLSGRTGIHSEPLGRILAEMQYLPRMHPEAVW